MLNVVRYFSMNCIERIERADKREKLGKVLKGELAINHTRFNKIAEDISVAADEVEELMKKLAEKKTYKMDLEVQTKIIVKLKRISKNAFDQFLATSTASRRQSRVM
ncbi:hypothetical protein ACOSQ4_004018 [Xanthoceras sorbifolium]